VNALRADEYLDQIAKIDAIVINKSEESKKLDDEYKRLKALASGLGGFSVSERVQSTRDLQKNAHMIIDYVDIEQEIKKIMREIDELKRKRAEIIKNIERLPSAEYKVIYALFVQDCTLKEVAYKCQKSYEWVKQKKARGLKLIQTMIDAPISYA
jgi:DNA-directed RNA polymerase specialized sigma subunit